MAQVGAGGMEMEAGRFFWVAAQFLSGA
jgi:hypothetical protein